MHLGPIFRSMLHNKTKVLLLVLEIAVTVTIVLNCLNLIFDQRRQLLRPTGLAEQELIAIDTDNFGTSYQDLQFRVQQMRQDADTLRAIPGVVNATPISNFPLQGGGSSFQVRPLDSPNAELVRSPLYSVDHHFIQTLGLELVEGREFTEEDLPTESGPRIANIIITQDLADALFPDGGAVGQALFTGDAEFPDIIVGVVRHMFTPYGGGPMETRITFYANSPAFQTGSSFLVRAEEDDFDEVYGAIESALLAGQEERVISVQPLTDVKKGGFLLNMFMVRVLGAIILLLLFVTGLGIFGMTSFSVTQRTKQVGTRRALGATKLAIIGHFLVENCLITAVGLAVGLIGAFALNIALVNNIDSQPLGAELIAIGAAILFAVSLIATAAPARRASNLAPALATRSV